MATYFFLAKGLGFLPFWSFFALGSSFFAKGLGFFGALGIASSYLGFGLDFFFLPPQGMGITSSSSSL